MNMYQSELVEEIKKAGKQPIENFGKKYIGTDKDYYGLKTAENIRIAREWVKRHQDISLADFKETLNCLSRSNCHEEYTMIGRILKAAPKFRKEVKPEWLREWLTRAQGWAEIDVICQMCFGPEDFLNNWEVWEKDLLKFATDEVIQVRRASLVLLTMPVRRSDDKRLAEVAILNTEKLKTEKDILITKAVSWILRSLIKNHRNLVEIYLTENESTLPKVAVRETRRKLLTGKK